MSTTQVRGPLFSFLRASHQTQCKVTNTSGQSQENENDGQDTVTRVPRRTPMACTFCRGEHPCSRRRKRFANPSVSLYRSQIEVRRSANLCELPSARSRVRVRTSVSVHSCVSMISSPTELPIGLRRSNGLRSAVPALDLHLGSYELSICATVS